MNGLGQVVFIGAVDFSKSGADELIDRITKHDFLIIPDSVTVFGVTLYRWAIKGRATAEREDGTTVLLLHCDGAEKIRAHWLRRLGWYVIAKPYLLWKGARRKREL